MADLTIFELDPLGAQPADTDGFELERPGSPGTPYYVLYSQLKQTGAQILNPALLTALGANPDDADYFYVWDSSAAALKKILFSDMIATEGVADLTPLTAPPAAGDLIEILDIDDFADGLDGTSKSLTIAYLFTSPTFVTPALGTPASGVLTNVTGLLPGGVTFAGADKVLGSTAIGAGSAIDFTPAMRQLADDLTHADMRTTLGLGSLALQAAGAVAITGGTIVGTTIDGVSIKSYVDNLVAGLKWKATVKLATTAAGTLASDFENGDTIDGVALVTGDRILIKDQAAGAENGIYIVAASGAPTRATDADSGTELVSATVTVEQGTANADLSFICTNNLIVLGTTSIVFVNFGASIAGALLATNNLSDLANAGTARTNLGLGALAVLASVATANLDDDAVTFAKMQNISANVLLGRDNLGTGNVKELTFSVVAQGLLDDVSYPAMRTTLGVALGTDVQAFSANLATLAALGNWKVAYTDGSGVQTALALGSTGKVLQSAGVGAVPVFADGWTIVQKTADEAVASSTTLQDDDALVISLAASTTYTIRGTVFYKIADIAADFKFDVNYTGTTTGDIAFWRGHTVVDGTAFPGACGSAFNIVSSLFSGATGQGFVTFACTFTTNASGTFSFRWAQNSSSGTATSVLKGSFLEWMIVD